LNDAIDWSGCTSSITTPQELHDLAWEFALPEEAVQQHLEMRLHKAKEAREKRERRDRQLQEAKAARQVRAQKALAFKLGERQAQSRRAWEERIATICARLQVQYDNALLDHVSRQSLTSLTKGGLTNEIIERIIRQYFSHKLILSVRNKVQPPSMPLQPMPVTRTKAPKDLVKRDRPYKGEWSS
jgi:hypothetical protein